jgi:hypothetical protein
VQDSEELSKKEENAFKAEVATAKSLIKKGYNRIKYYKHPKLKGI